MEPTEDSKAVDSEALPAAIHSLMSVERGERVIRRLIPLLDSADLHGCDPERLMAVSIVVDKYCSEDRHGVVKLLREAMPGISDPANALDGIRDLIADTRHAHMSGDRYAALLKQIDDLAGGVQ